MAMVAGAKVGVGKGVVHRKDIGQDSIEVKIFVYVFFLKCFLVRCHKMA